MNITYSALAYDFSQVSAVFSSQLIILKQRNHQIELLILCHYRAKLCDIAK